MKRFLGIVMMSLLIVIFSGCGGGGSSATGGATAGGAGGVGAKGPFVQSSTVTAYKLDSHGVRSTTDINATVTTDNLGTYLLSSIPWSGPTEIVISGNYFNENTGAVSTTPVSLSSVVSIALGQNISANINIFTDLEARYILALMNGGTSFADAKAQARSAIVDLFNLPAGTVFEDLDLTDGSEHNAANAELLRASAAIAKDPSVLDGLRDGIKDGNMTNESGLGEFVRFGELVDDVNLTDVSRNIENDLNVSDAPDVNDTDANATYVVRNHGHAPVLDAIADVTVEENSAQFNVNFNATDADGDSLTYSYSLSNDTKLDASISGSSLSLTPKLNQNGVVVVTAKVEDNTGLLTSRTFTVIITPVNNPPVANDDTNTTSEDTNITLSVLSNDTDVDGDTLSIARVTQGTHGAVSHTASSVTYSPNADYSGTDSFTYTISDGNGGRAIGTVNITVTPVNDAPVLNPIPDINTTEDTPFSLDINATDADGDHIQYSFSLSNSLLAHGGISTYTDGATINITPNLNKNGTFTITARAEDGNGGVDTKTFTVTITPVNDAPVANDDANTTLEDTNITLSVLSNDTDVDGDTLSIARVTQGTHGAVSHTASSVTYSPNADYSGTDSFTYTISDGNGGRAIGTVNITVTSVNDAPVANDDTNTTPEDTAKTLNILANDTDADGDTLSVFSVTQPVHGSVTIGNGSLSVIYTPSSNYNGSDSFTYTASDGHGGTATATVNLTVTAVNDAPVAQDFNGVLYDQNTVQSGTVTATDVDGDLNATGYVLDGRPPIGGNLTFENNGSFTFDPNGDFDHLPLNQRAVVTFSYTASDTNGSTSNSATVTLHLVGINDAPTVENPISGDTVYVGDAINNSVVGVFNDVDDNDTLTYSGVGMPTGVNISSDGNITGTVSGNPGIYDINITATDSNGLVAVDNFKVTVNYPATAADVNNTAWVLSSGTKVVFYPNNEFVAVGVDGNSSFYDDGAWDVNDSMHAIQLISSDGSTDLLYLPHSGPAIGDLVTDRFMDPNEPSDERSILILQDVIDISGNIQDLNSSAITSDEVNSTAIRIVDGPTVNLFADGTSQLIDNADQNITLSYTEGYWDVQNGILTLLDANMNSEANVSFAQSNLNEGTLGYHEDANGDGLLTIRDIVDINKTDPRTDPYALNVSDISRKAMIFTNHIAMHFYDINSSNQGKYWLKGRDDTGVVKENGIYELNTTNGTIDLNSSSGDFSILTFNSSPKKGTLILNYFPDDNSTEPLVVRKVFGFGSDIDSNFDHSAASLSSVSFENKAIEFTNQKTIAFYKDGFFVEHGLSVTNQKYYTNYGRWLKEADYVTLNYVDGGSNDFYMKFNDANISKGVRSSTFSTQSSPYPVVSKGIVKKVFELTPSMAFDTYPEYMYQAFGSDDPMSSTTTPVSFDITINSTSYSVRAYSNVEITNGSSNYNGLRIHFYGADSGNFYVDQNFTSLVLKVYKNGTTFVGSFGPFTPSDGLDLGDNPFSK